MTKQQTVPGTLAHHLEHGTEQTWARCRVDARCSRTAAREAKATRQQRISQPCRRCGGYCYGDCSD